MDKISIDRLNMHLFDAIERLKSNNDKDVSENEKMDIDTAKAIADIGKVVIDGYKVKVQALALLSKADNPNAVKKVIADSGIAPEGVILLDQSK